MDHCEEHKHDLDEDSVFPCPLCDYGSYAVFMRVDIKSILWVENCMLMTILCMLIIRVKESI